MQVWTLASFPEQREEGEEAKFKKKNVANISWFWPNTRGEGLTFSFLRPSIHGGPGPDVSCELNKDVLS